ncbi:hypothetical protein D3C87_1779740 [compost metagenome]
MSDPFRFDAICREQDNKHRAISETFFKDLLNYRVTRANLPLIKPRINTMFCKLGSQYLCGLFIRMAVADKGSWPIFTHATPLLS